MNKKPFANKIIAIILVLTLLLGVCACFGYATTESELKSELSDINSDIAALEKELKSGQSKVTSLTKQIKNIETKIYSAQKQINTLTQKVNETKEQISVTLDELNELQAQIDTQDSNLNERLRAMYKNGNVGLLSVLLGSSTMSDFLTNLEMIKKIYASDQELLEELQVDYNLVVEKKEELAALKETLLAQQAELTEYKAELTASEDALATQKKSVESDNSALEAQIDSLNEEAEKLTAEILELQSDGAYAGGNMCWPAESSTRVTSQFGQRLHPILKVYKLHTGIDIGASYGTNILAANSGTVIKSAYNASGYGYYLMIDHGGGIVTLYAHSSKLLVKKGDVVTRGQVIAKVGSTGMSTGAHLHFEVRVNGVYTNPLDYVTAGKY